MIEVNELRTGIILKPIRPRHHEEFITVESFDGAIVNCTFRGYDLDELHPIPLTEEILLKCGFEKEGSYNYRYNNLKIHEINLKSCWVDASNSEHVWYFVFHQAGKMFHIKCKYLHQLQNLYFALTGKELEVKL